MGNELRLVCFELQHQQFAFSIDSVRETLSMQPITRVFLTPPCVAGVFSLRGEIVPALDLGPLLAISRRQIGDDSKIVVLKNALGTVGVIVDRLLDQQRVEDIQPPPPSLAPEVAALLKGVATLETGLLRILDASAILDVEALRALRKEAAS